jgi:hypothetical protein
MVAFFSEGKLEEDWVPSLEKMGKRQIITMTAVRMKGLHNPWH